MNWLADYMGVKSAPASHHSEDDDEPAPKSEPKPHAKKAAAPPVHRGYNWRNRHGLREVGELRP